MDESGLRSMCRICMRSDSKMILIGLFEHIVQNHTLAHVVSLVGAVEVQQDDELPKLCCTNCLREVEAAYKLRNLCQESDVKLRSHLQNMVAVVKKEPFSDDEIYSQNPEVRASINAGCAQKDVVNTSFTPDALKCEYDEITIEEIRITDANYSKSDQCSESKKKFSDDVDVNNSNNQELEAHGLPHSFDVCPAVKFRCCGCISSFNTLEELHAHGHEKHYDRGSMFPLMETQCDICFKILRNERAYDFHKTNVMYNYRCRICDQVLITWKQASAHYRLKHAQRKRQNNRTTKLTADQALICCGCEMRFYSADELKAHSETIHLPEKPSADEKKPVTCNICYRNFSTQAVLRKHKIRYLNRSKNHQCKECGKSYRYASELRHHEQSHTQKTFSCSQCPKVYVNISSFRYHLYLHSQPSDKFRCNECGRSFRVRRDLDEHSRSHTGERPYQCKECGKSFNAKRNLVEHSQAHWTVRPFSCPQCPATFKLKSCLIAHATIHTGKKKYTCPLCSKGFSTKYLQIEHVERDHPEQVSENRYKVGDEIIR